MGEVEAPNAAEWALFLSLCSVLTLLPVLLVLAGLLRRMLCSRAARRVAPGGGVKTGRGSAVIEPAVATAAELKLEAKQVAASKHRWAVSISLQLVGSMLFSLGLVERMLSRGRMDWARTHVALATSRSVDRSSDPLEAHAATEAATIQG